MTVVLVVAAPIILALFAMQMEKLESWILPSAPAAAEPVPELADEPGGDRVDNDDRDTAGENTEDM
ncbi:MAG TPA: hypothetical protein K8V93_05490 [Corynebacterium pollutisoli]|jgi:hypothetical protein|nr:hypothetical protein [Corynebacterium pollutisoli]